jgi:hypothetical protein
VKIGKPQFLCLILLGFLWPKKLPDVVYITYKKNTTTSVCCKSIAKKKTTSTTTKRGWKIKPNQIKPPNSIIYFVCFVIQAKSKKKSLHIFLSQSPLFFYQPPSSSSSLLSYWNGFFHQLGKCTFQCCNNKSNSIKRILMN